MKDSIQTAQDIFYRNKFLSSFHIKIPSHHASKEFINILLNTHIINKLALLPFYQHQKLALLYKESLEYLLHLSKEKYKNKEFMEGLILHLQNWEVNMSIFDSWRYTRAVFYYLQEKTKNNEPLYEEIMLKRAILQPNKHQFIKKSQNTTFKNEQLKLIKVIFKNEYVNTQGVSYDLPQDVLLMDDNQSWIQVQKANFRKKQQVQKVVEYLHQYENTGILRFLKSKIGDKNHIEQILKDLRLRNHVFKRYKGAESPILTTIIDKLAKKYDFP